VGDADCEEARGEQVVFDFLLFAPADLIVDLRRDFTRHKAVGLQVVFAGYSVAAAQHDGIEDFEAYDVVLYVASRPTPVGRVIA
jgi:hypothetical protein